MGFKCNSKFKIRRALNTYQPKRIKIAEGSREMGDKASAIVLAAGSGSRMNSKIYVIEGKTGFMVFPF